MPSRVRPTEMTALSRAPGPSARRDGGQHADGQGQCQKAQQKNRHLGHVASSRRRSTGENFAQRFQSIAAGRVEVIRIVCRVTVSVQIQVDDKNTDQMLIQCDERPCQHHASA